MNRPNHKAQAFEGVSRGFDLRSRATTLALLLTCLAPSGTHAALGVLAGSGTKASPYEVSDYADLAMVGTGSYDPTATYRLMADIDATPSDTSNSDSGLAPLVLKGTFHGGGHTISMLSIHRPGHDAALFGLLDVHAVVDSLGLVDASIAGSHHVAVLAATNQGSILACSSSGFVVGDTTSSHVGGLVGTNFGTIRASHSSSRDSGDSGISAGGLVGWNSGTIESSSASGTVTAGKFAGGLVGVNSGVLDSCQATGAISGTHPYAAYGGLVGSSTEGHIHLSNAAGAVSAYGDSVCLGGLIGRGTGGVVDSSNASGGVTANAEHAKVGGLVGQSSGETLRACHASGAVTATGMYSAVGGLVGTSGPADSLGSCYATGGATATGGFALVGGLVGQSDSATIAVCYATGAVTTTGTNALAGGLVASAGVGDKIRQSYASGPVTATGSNVFAGGLVGLNRGLVEACYATSKVVNSESSFLPGGLVGNDSGSILSSYWGLETASSTIGVGYGLSTGSATGLISVAFAVTSSFVGWDFASTWTLSGADTVPRLRALASSYGTPVSVHPIAVRNAMPYTWSIQGKRMTISAPGRTFEVVVADLSGRVLARTSATGTAALDLDHAGAMVVRLRSRDLHESISVSTMR
jgi:The GLUG motif